MHLQNLLLVIRYPAGKTAAHSAESPLHKSSLSLFLEIGNLLLSFGHVCLVEICLGFRLHLVFCVAVFAPAPDRSPLVEFIGVFVFDEVLLFSRFHEHGQDKQLLGIENLVVIIFYGL